MKSSNIKTSTQSTNAHFFVLLAVSAFGFLSGCVPLKSAVTQPSQSASMFGDEYTRNLAEKYFGKGGENGELAVKVDSFEKYLADAAAAEGVKKEMAKAEARRIRNQVTYDLLRISDKLYGEFKDGLFGGKAAMDTGFKIVDLALTGTAAVVGANEAKTALAAAATFLNGSKLAIDESFYAKQTTASLISIMDGLRAVSRLKIIEGLEQEPDAFTIHHALALVQEYHRRGSLVEAVVELSRITNAKADEQVSKLAKKEIGE